jgi:hypothetical protein
MKKLLSSTISFTALIAWARPDAPALLGVTLALATSATAAAAPPPTGGLAPLPGSPVRCSLAHAEPHHALTAATCGLVSNSSARRLLSASCG